MTSFVEPTLELLNRIEPEAGEVARPNKRRAITEFWPDWEYIASPSASLEAVVAALTLSYDGAPDRVWQQVIRVRCPHAQRLLAEHGVSIGAVITGKAPAGLIESVARSVNTELGGYEVLAIVDFVAMVAEIVGQLGAVPEFLDDRPGPHAPRPHSS